MHFVFGGFGRIQNIVDSIWATVRFCLIITKHSIRLNSRLQNGENGFERLTPPRLFIFILLRDNGTSSDKASNLCLAPRLPLRQIGAFRQLRID